MISGQVTTTDGDPVQGVTITLDKPDNTTATTTTDAQGIYSFPGLPPVPESPYTVTPSGLGYVYTPSSQEVIVTNKNERADFVASFPRTGADAERQPHANGHGNSHGHGHGNSHGHGDCHGNGNSNAHRRSGIAGPHLDAPECLDRRPGGHRRLHCHRQFGPKHVIVRCDRSRPEALRGFRIRFESGPRITWPGRLRDHQIRIITGVTI